ncbi:hypothetical protein HGRIS_008088 [Hohenbuehelia grisea]|uniref:Adipose-regulatory protein-domain-containing protein n=1 Tax=Hohenbuehelia grisea TaxID=104357 RepID=A0ABR3J7A6_9AGAR
MASIHSEFSDKTYEQESKLTVQRSTPGIISTLAYLPVRVNIWFLTRIISLFRPFAPQIIPLVVFAFLIPTILALSALAGWIVWRSVPVAWEAPLYLQYGDGVPPYAETIVAGIAAQQPYDIFLRLSVPIIPTNLALGNFMADLRLSTSSNQTITSIRRAATILEPKKILFFSPKVVRVDIPLLDSFVIGTSKVTAAVQVGRRDHWKLLGNVKHYGLSGLVSRFPLAAGVISAFIFLAVASLVLGACVLPLVLPKGGVDESYIEPSAEDTLPPPKASPYPPFDDDEKPSRRRRRSRRSQSSSQRVVKSEPISTPMPPADEAEPPLRHRRSRLAENKAETEL